MGGKLAFISELINFWESLLNISSLCLLLGAFLFPMGVKEESMVILF